VSQIDWEAIIRALFLYRPEAPMIFPTLEFWVWLTLIMGFYGLLLQRKAYQAGLWLLLAFSVFFYYKSTGAFVLIFLGTLAFSYFTAQVPCSSRPPCHQKALAHTRCPRASALSGLLQVYQLFH
jgi:alginate O-acetyltransferase complex protein AlgI